MVLKRAFCRSVSLASPLALACGADAQTLSLSPVWLNATARELTPMVMKSSSCQGQTCTLALDSSAGLILGDTVSGTFIAKGDKKSHPGAGWNHHHCHF